MSHDPNHTDPDTGTTPASPSTPASDTLPAERTAPVAVVEDAGATALSEALRSSFNIVRFLMVLLVAVFVLSGLFIVAPNEVAVVLRFGKPVGVGADQLRQPGLHWKLPYPLDELVRIPIGETKTITSTAGWYAMTAEEAVAGSKDPDTARPFLSPGVDGYTLTGDGNIVHVRTTLNYRITDPLQYQFEFASPTNLLQNLLDNALFHAAARFNADDALYRRRAAFREAVIKRLTESATQLGVTLDPREVRIDPPLYVQTAFNEVLDSQQRRDTEILEAQSYARNATNQALGEASVIVQNGLTLSNTIVQSVATDATNFLGLLPAWQETPRLLRERLLAERSQRVMTNAQFKAFLPARADQRPRELRLNLNKDIEPPKFVEPGTHN